MANDTTTWTLGELCDYWRANLARLQASMDFRTLAAVQELLRTYAPYTKGDASGLPMPADKAAEGMSVRVPSWIPKPEGKRGLPFRFRALAHVFSDSELRDGDLIAGELNAIAAEFESTTNPFEQKGPFGAPQAAFAFPSFDLMKVLALLSRFGPLLARIDQIKAMPQGKERIAATAKLVADISSAVAEMLGTGTTIRGPFGAARKAKKAGKR